MKIFLTSKYHPLHNKRRQIRIPFGASKFLAVFEGLEGGFAIGSSIVVALSLSIQSQKILLLSALVSIVVNGFNNASVKYSSEHYLDELDGREVKHKFRQYFAPSILEFIAYFVISFVSVIPLIVISDVKLAVLVNVAITLLILFLAGFWRGYILQMSKLRDAIETFLLGLGIIVFGAITGLIILGIN